MLSRLSLSCDRKDRPYSRRVTKKPRQRFTPWLHDQIEKGDIEGLEWINKEEGIFRVPWVRVDKPEFEPGHAELFKRWAFHTGKYRKGDQPDPSTWKTRFRCALRKMQEIKEIRELGKLEGNKPYRAFKFEPKLKGESFFSWKFSFVFSVVELPFVKSSSPTYFENDFLYWNLPAGRLQPCVSEIRSFVTIKFRFVEDVLLKILPFRKSTRSLSRKRSWP